MIFYVPRYVCRYVFSMTSCLYMNSAKTDLAWHITSDERHVDQDVFLLY